ncbi:uncharacterized protein ARMOST_17450 [Armillaria ostoyae]|uniref:Uncharacterized protein n=1 Tax=Armillaria ostoyae TaxID=47428 RepID=A0A284RZ23_ARMOS|nr:uncharacterized protein ARMOST_17450 [Armillaria ostoyae]
MDAVYGVEKQRTVVSVASLLTWQGQIVDPSVPLASSLLVAFTLSSEEDTIVEVTLRSRDIVLAEHACLQR